MRISPAHHQKSGFTAPGPYDIDNVSNRFLLALHQPDAGRRAAAASASRSSLGLESHTDMMARALRLDPVEFRRKNLLSDGRPQATGTLMKDAAIAAVLDRVALRMNWNGPFGAWQRHCQARARHRDRLQASISPTTSIAVVNGRPTAASRFTCSTVDMGQGSDTANAQIVAEVLKSAERVRWCIRTLT